MKGFTLIELMIVLTMVAALVGTMMPVLRRSLVGHRVEAAGWDLASVIEYARGSARRKGVPHRVVLHSDAYWVERLDQTGRRQGEAGEGREWKPVPGTFGSSHAFPSGVRAKIMGMSFEGPSDLAFDARGYLASPVRVFLQHRRGDQVTVVVPAWVAMVEVLKGEVDPVDQSDYEELGSIAFGSALPKVLLKPFQP